MLRKFFEKKQKYVKITHTVSFVEVKDLSQLKLVIACSGGPDSMALFELCHREGISLVCAHVNYRHRETANRDEKIAEAMCRKYNVPFEVFYPVFESGNFQNWARKVRYQFFYEVMKKYECDGVAVAHHEDDAIETILFQNKRGMIPEYYGIQEKTELFGCTVYRPLLNMSKKSLREFCDMNQIAYGLDETNETDEYERNRIRHHQVSHMNETQRQQVLFDARMKNLDLKIVREMVDVMLMRYPSVFPYEVFERLSELEKIILLRKWIQIHLNKEAGTKECEDLIRQLSKEGNVEIQLSNCVKLSKMYQYIEIIHAKDVLYSYVLEKLELMETEYFKVSDSGKSTEALTLSEDDFPLTIRNAQKGDAISLRFGTKKLNRWFIDRKIPRSERNGWPVVLNRYNEVILVPGIGCNCTHYSNNPTCFVIK